ncbi:serine protease gd [Drosophila grimshawi]|uniref:serine protease gd n=1 Tax=Drosophila grimshawi TaxID=7222 RepID=UPI001C934E8D|nr:serine protease gd [Drosophila grimshawi]
MDEKMRMLLPGFLLSLLWLISPTSAQLPNNACSQYFEYLSFNQQFIGHISVRLNPQFENVLVVEFSQRGAYTWSYVGSLTLLDSDEQTNSNLRFGEPINYRVDFPLPSSPPKVTQIRLNNQVLCSAAQYPLPRTAITLTHKLTSPQPLSFLGPNRIPTGVNPPWSALPNEPQPVYNIEEIPYQELTTPRTRPVAQPQTDLGSRAAPKPRPDQVEQSLSSICGRERALTTPLIFQGEQLQRGQLPWLVGIYERSLDNGLPFFCGGTLLSSWTVLSAAHCFRFPGRDLPANRTVISLGRNTIDIVSAGELRDVSQLVFHEEYEPRSAQADIVLIRLAKQVAFNDFIVPICLWSENYPLQLPSGYKTYVAGWGADENGNTNTKVAKIIDTNIVTEADCLRELPRRLVQPKTICAKRDNAGPCGSDGGGGLMLRENNVWLLRGVISLGLTKDNTCDLSKAALFTDVAKHIAWVRQNMWE